MTRTRGAEPEMLEALDLLIAGALAMEPSTGVRYAQAAQRQFAAIEATLTAELDERERRNAANAGGTRSRKETSKATKRSKAVGQNPRLSDKLASGSIGTEQLDAIADASDKSDGDAANDRELLDDIENAKPDDAEKITQRWLEDRDENASSQSRFDRQNERRGVARGRDRATGCDTLTLRGPEEKIAKIRKAVGQRSDELYEADGGRDVANEDHRRTHQQRMFDAAYELLLNPNGSSRSSKPSAHPRTMVHVSIVVDAVAEADIRATCPDGSGYLPGSVLERYACGSMLGGTVFSEKGEVLWHGRQRRYATPAQFAALIARDHGCVLCGRSPEFCEAHHLVPFNSPNQGKTNIDELALLCSSCHDWLHDSKRPLVWANKPPNSGHRGSGSDSDADGDGHRPTEAAPTAKARRIWSTRPATFGETPPSRPARKAKNKPHSQPAQDRPTSPGLTAIPV